MQSVLFFVDRIRGSDAWKQAEFVRAFVHSREVLQEAGLVGKRYEGPNDQNALLTELKASTEGNQQTPGSGSSYLRAGNWVVSRRGPLDVRYRPTDQLLNNVSCLLRQTSDGVRRFWTAFQQYRLVIGAREAERVLPTDEFDFRASRERSRLETRLDSWLCCADCLIPRITGEPLWRADA